MNDLISRQAAIDAVSDGIISEEESLVECAEECNAMIEWAVETLKKLPSAQPEQRWSGLWSEPEDEASIYGEKLMEGDTIYLFGVEGMVTQECGAWGWGSAKYVPWEELESKIPHGNHEDFCYCDNFVSFWELKWNFDDGDDWDGVPFIRHGRDGHD